MFWKHKLSFINSQQYCWKLILSDCGVKKLESK
jgi:hypothetical protein